VDRPNRQVRRRKGKTDTVDAIEAARAAQAQRQIGAAKTRDGQVEAIRALVVAKRSAKSSRIKTMNQIRHLGFTASEEIRLSLHGLSRKMLPRKAAAMRPRTGQDPVTFATKTALRTLGQRALALEAEMDQIDVHARALAQPGNTRGGLEWYRAFPTDHRNAQVWKQEKLAIPVLALGGEHNYGPTTVAMLEEFAENVSGGSISGCAHWLPEERPAETADAVLKFLAG
jgi:pimeloyl-ACP methyl ester carboxylesterase